MGPLPGPKGIQPHGPRPEHNIAEASASPLTAVISVAVDRELVLARLRVDAARRGVSVDRLVQDLLQTIATDRLTDAVMEDNVATPAPPPPPRPRRGRPPSSGA